MEWQPIKTAPKTWDLILLLDRRECEANEIHASGVCVGYWADTGMDEPSGVEGWINWWESDPDAERWETFSPTHWMPLPAPPA